jgi:hypothetical protein
VAPDCGDIGLNRSLDAFLILRSFEFFIISHVFLGKRRDRLASVASAPCPSGNLRRNYKQFGGAENSREQREQSIDLPGVRKFPSAFTTVKSLPRWNGKAMFQRGSGRLKTCDTADCKSALRVHGQVVAILRSEQCRKENPKLKPINAQSIKTPLPAHRYRSKCKRNRGHLIRAVCQCAHNSRAGRKRVLALIERQCLVLLMA